MRFCFLLVGLVFFNAVFASGIYKGKEVVEEEHLWLGVISQSRITKNFGWWNDIHLRNKENFGASLNNFMIRTGPQFYIKDNFRPGLVYLYLHNFENDDRKVAQCEHRLAQQFWFGHNHKQVRFSHLFRNENRWLQKVENGKAVNDFVFRDRMRYAVLASISLSQKGFEPGTLMAIINNEIMVNVHAEDNFYVYDQNRFFAGLGVLISNASQVHLGYMNLYQQKSVNYELAHAIRFSFFQNFDFRKKL